MLIDIPTVSGGVTDVSVVGGDLSASIDSGTLYLLGSTSSKDNPNISLSANSLTFNSLYAQNVSVAADSDAVMDFYSDNTGVAKVRKVDERTFAVNPQPCYFY